MYVSCEDQLHVHAVGMVLTFWVVTWQEAAVYGTRRTFGGRCALYVNASYFPESLHSLSRCAYCLCVYGSLNGVFVPPGRTM